MKSIFLYCLTAFMLVNLSCEKVETPIADFIIEDTLLIVGEEIHFLDLSENNPTEWTWKFFDGPGGFVKAPVHKYSKSGKYDVYLSVSNESGSDTLIKKDYALVVDTGRVSDIDGNIYETVKLGNSWWMAENLATTKYNDNTEIMLAETRLKWGSPSIGQYCWFNNDKERYKKHYGALYNASVVMSDKVCPQDWHVPTDTEWLLLIAYLGSENTIGNLLKEPGTSHWESTTEDVINRTNFRARPGGIRYGTAEWGNLKQQTNFWTSTINISELIIYQLSSKSSSIERYTQESQKGSSIRCIKDHSEDTF